MTVQALKNAITKLPPSQRMQLVRWVNKSSENDAWDKQMEKDALAGKLDFLVEEGKAALRAGTLRPLKF